MTKLNQEIELQIVELYKQKMKTAELCLRFNIEKSTIQRVLKKHNTNGLFLGINRKPTERESLALKLYYEERLPLKEIKMLTRYSSTEIYRHLKRFGTGCNRGKDASRKYTIENERFFENIDSDTKGYFLGFIASDGYISENAKSKGVQIQVQKSDVFVLEAFCDAIGVTRQIIKVVKGTGFSKDKEYARIQLNSVKMVDDLVKIGIKQNKSRTINFPQISFENENSCRGFIRGILDGDGTCSYKFSNGVVRSPVVRFLGTKSVIQGVSYTLNKYTNIPIKEPKLIHKDFLFCTDYYSLGQINLVFEWLYKDCSVYLNRKYEKVKFLSDYYKSNSYKKLSS